MHGLPLDQRRDGLKNGNPPGRLLESAPLRSEDSAGDAVPVSGHAERALPASRWTQHRSEDTRGDREHPAREPEARARDTKLDLDVALSARRTSGLR